MLLHLKQNLVDQITGRVCQTHKLNSDLFCYLESTIKSILARESLSFSSLYCLARGFTIQDTLFIEPLRCKQSANKTIQAIRFSELQVICGDTENELTGVKVSPMLGILFAEQVIEPIHQ